MRRVIPLYVLGVVARTFLFGAEIDSMAHPPAIRIRNPCMTETSASIRSVLVCDDERHIVRLIESNLRRQGYTVVCAYGGREAIERLERETFDMAVLDIDMPDLGGLDVVRWIRSDERAKAMRVVLIGGRSPAPQEAVSSGALYLTKPFGPTDLFR